MAEEKNYLDAEGLTRVKKYIDDQFSALKEAIDLLNDSNGTPGSIQSMIDKAIGQLKVEDLSQDDDLIIYGGSAPEQEGE